MEDCVACGERLEFSLSVADLQAPPDAAEPPAQLELAYHGQRLRFRCLNSYDLATVARCADPAEARRLLARRCLLEPDRVELTAELVDLLAEQLAHADPRAETLLALTCPACGQAQQRLFDVAAFVWTELVAQAQRLLREVDLLARRYGWREADILALIIFNQPMNQLGEGQQLSLASRAGSIAAGAVANQLTGSIANSLNLDQFEINLSPDTGSAAELTLGQQLGQNLYVKVQQGIGDNSQTNFVLEYEFAKWLRLQTNVLEGSTTQQQLFQKVRSTGADLVFSFQFK